MRVAPCEPQQKDDAPPTDRYHCWCCLPVTPLLLGRRQEWGWVGGGGMTLNDPSTLHATGTEWQIIAVSWFMGV